MTMTATMQPHPGMSLADFTTWRVGGPAEWLVEPSSGRLFTPGLTPNAGVPLTQL